MCEMSASIGHLAEALSKAQAQIKGAVKDRPNPFFNSSYADLASVWEACRDPLSANGLAIVQTLASSVVSGFDVITVYTILIHSSGEWIKSALAVTPAKKVKKDASKEGDMLPSKDPQLIAAAITHARRISLAAIVGIAQIDQIDEEEPLPTVSDPKPRPIANPIPQPVGSNGSGDNDKALKLRSIITEKVMEIHGGDLTKFEFEGAPLSLMILNNSDLGKLSKIANLVSTAWSQWKKTNVG